ncbi:hypothetical protein JMJ35_006401 [Cladonia borealis]|uniref:Uncharacterized protein n=1 Tax=Cladonia borealis TaxID=184061 RepID=A0AA39QYX8_9LECA|nr:hypothetical protein JMJ35_006401 [Cladonia borealis]
MTGEQETFIPYRKGLDPSVMRLGCMSRGTEPRYASRPDFDLTRFLFSDEDKAKWAIVDQRPHAVIVSEGRKVRSFGGGLQSLFDADFWHSPSHLAMAVGVNGSVVELREPEKFFEDVLLQDLEARRWISANLSVDKKLDYLRIKLRSPPGIWLLTGIYLIEDAHNLLTIDAASGISAQVTMPLPDPSMITQLLQANPNLHFKVGSGKLLASNAQILGPKVWAAQFQMIGPGPMLRRPGEEFAFNRVKLLNIYSSYMRGDEAESEDVVLTRKFATGQDVANNEDEEDLARAEEYRALFEAEMQTIDKLRAVG